MRRETIRVERESATVTVTIDRPESNNSLNTTLLHELNAELDAAEADPDCRIVALQGTNGVFCSGMDFQAVADQVSRTPGGAPRSTDPASRAASMLFMDTLRRLSLMPRVVIAKVDGRAMAGGLGLVAASDIVLATPDSQFSLPEVLWGLLPCCVAPYLIRRVGFQNAYRLALTTLPITAARARGIGLVDDVAPALESPMRQLAVRLSRLQPSALADLKRYFRKLWLITEQMEELAVAEIARLTGSPEVQANIRAFVEGARFPWDRAPAPAVHGDGRGPE